MATIAFTGPFPQDGDTPVGTITFENGIITSATGVAAPFLRTYREIANMTDQECIKAFSTDWTNGYYLAFLLPE
jgi:hypothetical protein